MKCILQNMLLNTGCEISDGRRSHRQHQIFLFWRCSPLINSNIKIKLWCFHMREWSLRGHMGVSNPIGSLKLRKKPMLCFIDSSPGVWRQSRGWIFHFSLYVWTESCIPVFKVSLQTCPIADINKVIRWAIQDSERNSMLGALEEPSDSTFWQFRLSCFIVLWGRWVLFDFECYHRAYRLTGGESRFAILCM